MGLLSRILRGLPVPRDYRQYLMDSLMAQSFSQLGEDKVIDNQLTVLGLEPTARGFYLDIGAFHPTVGSNTYRFYRFGSAGVCVDVGDEKKTAFRRLRRRDVFIDAAVVPAAWAGGETLRFHLGSTDDYGSQLGHVDGVSALGEVSEDRIIECRALRADKLFPLVSQMDSYKHAAWRLLNVDIEGLDLEVISDLDLDAFQFDVIAVEEFVPEEYEDSAKIEYLHGLSPTVHFLRSKGYALQSVCGPTLVFARASAA